ncbi:MmyB family transcriptional regulator [Streptomyces europaeiscabiei]|uniref:MmyB family transcriptional regulator n=1 Tax=Streptomyces europaeiscabiei TaxID=146819 RepID=UPI0038D464AC
MDSDALYEWITTQGVCRDRPHSDTPPPSWTCGSAKSPAAVSSTFLVRPPEEDVLQPVGRPLQPPDLVDQLVVRGLPRRCDPRVARSAPEVPRAPSRTVRPGVKLLLESLRPYPAYVASRTNDILAGNPGGLRLLPGFEEWPSSATSPATSSSSPPPATCSTTGAPRSAAGGPAARARRRTPAEEPGVRPVVGTLRHQGSRPRPQDLPPPAAVCPAGSSSPHR